MKTQKKPVMIFHVPFPLNPNATSASGIRPVKLRNAFKQIGYEVLEISGLHPQRRKLIKNIKKYIQAGKEIDFVYSEAATTPTGLGEPITLHTSLKRDISFLRFCKKHQIPVGIFYRDIYWQFPEYEERVGKVYSKILRSRYRADLKNYQKAVDIIYLPSNKMGDYLPDGLKQKVKELPPGAEIVNSQTPTTEKGPNIFYVGGLNSYYRMHETIKGVTAVSGAQFIICTRESEWTEAKNIYKPLITKAVNVVHKNGSELEPLYDDSHIGSLFMEPIEYRDFAAPMKLYEYLGHGKPVIATEGSLAAKFVTENKIGWALPYSAEALAKLLEKLQNDPAELVEVAERTKQVRQQHTWEFRARQVAQDLTKKGRL